MGINSKCYIPNDVQAKDVVTAIAYLCGAERVKMDLQGGSFAAWFNRNEVSDELGKGDYKNHKVFVRSTHDIQYFTIEIAPTTCDEIWHSGSFFMYPDEKRIGYYMLYGGVSEFWEKIGRALVDLFGGYIDDNDCDSIDVDYKKRKPRKLNCPSNGEAWEEFQSALLNLPKLFDFVK